MKIHCSSNKHAKRIENNIKTNISDEYKINLRLEINITKIKSLRNRSRI